MRLPRFHVSGKMPASQERSCPSLLPFLETRLSGLAPRQGKVRDIFDLDDSLLMVATDRLGDRVRSWLRDSRQGRVLHAAVGLLEFAYGIVSRIQI